VGRRAVELGHPEQGPGRAHQHDEGICRYRRREDVSAAAPETAEAKAGTTIDAKQPKPAQGRKPFGISLGTTADNVDTAGSIFASFGAELVDAKGTIQIKSPAVRQALEYCQKLVKFLPADAQSWDDGSNNRARIAGNSSFIYNPPSAWAVAVRDAPAVAADTWHFPIPSGPKGRFEPHSMNFWGIWQFAQNKGAAKDLIEFLMQPDNVDARSTAVMGYDLPPFAKMSESKVWRVRDATCSR
jgi:hypothetical protein